MCFLFRGDCSILTEKNQMVLLEMHHRQILMRGVNCGLFKLDLGTEEIDVMDRR